MLADGLPFHIRQLDSVHLTPYGLRRLLAAGLVRQVSRGVYVDSAVPDGIELRATALALVVGDRGVACRTTAAWLFGLDVRPPGEHRLPPYAEVAVLEGQTPVRRPGCRSYVAQLAPDDVLEIGGVLVTTPLRTALDLARWLSRRDGLAALDAMLHLHLVELPALLVEVERFAGDRYVDRARELLRIAEPKTESPGESWTRLRLIDAGFPRPEAQYEVRDPDGRLIARLDLAYVKQRTGVEFDGEEDHSAESDVAHDEDRRRAMERRGWQVLVARKQHVLGYGPELELAVGEALGIEPRQLRRSA